MEMNVPVIAGTLSTLLFILSTLPMLLKAFRTKDLKSYSLGYILLSNLGNLIHSMYVFHLPPGPIWLLHTFYLVTTGLMLVWYLRYEWRPGLVRRGHAKETNDVRMDRSVSPVRSRTRPRKIPFLNTPFGARRHPFVALR